MSANELAAEIRRHVTRSVFPRTPCSSYWYCDDTAELPEAVAADLVAAGWGRTDRLTAERDHARDIAVSLESELAELHRPDTTTAQLPGGMSLLAVMLGSWATANLAWVAGVEHLNKSTIVNRAIDFYCTTYEAVASGGSLTLRRPNGSVEEWSIEEWGGKS